MSLGIRSLWRARMPIASHAGAVAIPRNFLRPAAQGSAAIHTSRDKRARSKPKAKSTPKTSATEKSEANALTDKKQESAVLSSGNWERTRPLPKNRERNDFIRNAFKLPDPERVDQLLSSAFALSAREYPSPEAQKASDDLVRLSARKLAGFETIWANNLFKWHFIVKNLDYTHILRLLKHMTPPRNNKKTSAMRIVLPPSWDLNISNQNVDYVDSHTGLLDKLRVFKDHGNTSATVVRGKSKTLAKAADELLAINENIQVFQLGKVSACDYQTKQLWPAIKDTEKVSEDETKENSLWIHREPSGYWIETKYEDVPRPTEWTPDSFEEYIKTLVCGRLRSHLVLPLYGSDEDVPGGPFFPEPDGIRIKLIMNAFKDPEARSSITAPALKTALAFIAPRGGHYAVAEELFNLAEDFGLPMDTEFFNVMLEGLVVKRDFRAFFKLLRTMKARFFHANERTWLLFLRLVQKDEVRRQVIVDMYSNKMMSDPAVTNVVAGLMAPLDAHAALRAGKTLDEVVEDHRYKYGISWFTYEALNSILSEFFLLRGHTKPSPKSYASLLRMGPNGPYGMDISTINVILQHSTIFKHWDAAIDALRLMAEHGCEPNEQTFDSLLELAASTSSPHTLGAIVFLGSHHHMFMNPRKRLKMVLIGRHRNKYWFHNKVPMLTSEMAYALKELGPTFPDSAVRRAVRALAYGTRGKTTVESIADILQAARTLDLELKEGGKPKRLEIRMKHIEEPMIPEAILPDAAAKIDAFAAAPPRITTFCLNNFFEPEALIVNWEPRNPNRRSAKEEFAENVPDWASFESTVSRILKDTIQRTKQTAGSKEAPAAEAKTESKGTAATTAAEERFQRKRAKASS